MQTTCIDQFIIIVRAHFYTKTNRQWLDDNDVPILMGGVLCKEGDETISECDTKYIQHGCLERKDIWLHCSNKTGNKKKQMI